MITVTECDGYLANCQKLGADPTISIERAAAIMGICHALIQLMQRIRRYDLIVGREDC